MPDKLFDDGEDFENEKFNQFFNNIYKKQTDLIKHDGNPIPWNILNEYGSYSSIDNYDSLFVEDDDLGNGLFGSVKISESNKPKKLSKKDLESLPTVDFKTHNYKDQDYKKTLEEKMKEREMATTMFKNMDMHDFEFNNDNTCGGYGISSGIGVNFDDYKDTGLLDDESDLKKQYDRMLEMRRK
jgi:hypothetical protein